jgi:multiple sugar transport system permease protein
LNSTDVVLTYMWKQAFSSIDLGYGAALSFLLAAAIGLVSLIEFRLIRRQETG